MLEDNVRVIIWFTGLGIIALGFLWLWVRAFRISLWWGLGFIIPNVDNWAHIGGILSGLALGFFYRPQSRDRRRVLGGLSAVVLVYGAYRIAANVFPGLG